MAISAQSAPPLGSLSHWAWYSERVWGCRDLRPWFDRVVADGVPIGEAWLTGDQCVVATGAHAGQTLGDLFAESPESLLGSSAPNSEAGGPSVSPLLIKVIFAKEKLSVQVHPDDAMAQKYGDPRGKTECWYVLKAEPGAQVACGIQAGVTLDGIKAGIETGTLESSLNLLDVALERWFLWMPDGSRHLAGVDPAGDSTELRPDLPDVRLRAGRELHIQKSLEATRLATRAGKIPPECWLTGSF